MGLNPWDSYLHRYCSHHSEKKELLTEGTTYFSHLIRTADPRSMGSFFFSYLLSPRMSHSPFSFHGPQTLMNSSWNVTDGSLPIPLMGLSFLSTQLRYWLPHCFINCDHLSPFPLPNDLTQALSPPQPRLQCTPLENLRKANTNSTKHVWKPTDFIQTYLHTYIQI